MKRLPLQRAEKILLISTVLSGGSILVLSRIYEKQNELPPAPRVELQIPPTPNAFDFIVAASSQTIALPWAKYSKGGGCLANGIDWEASCDQWKEPRPYTPAYDLKFPLSAEQTYLQANQRALQLWRQSLSMPLFVPDDLPRPQYSAWNRRSWVINAVRTQARADWQNGDLDVALDWLLLWHQDVCRSTLSNYGGKNHPKGIGYLNGASERRGEVMDELERLAPHLNAAQSQRSALKLQQNRALLPSRLEALQISKTLRLEFARQVCQSNDLRRSESLKHPETVEMDSVTQLRFRWANKKAGLKKLAAQWDWLITQD